MTKAELALLLEEGESYRLEFKRSVSADLPKELVAFANASGGRIFIGIDDRNQVVGTELSNHLLAQVEDMAAACDPAVEVRLEKLPAHRLLIVHVPEGTNKPYRCGKGFFLRNGATAQKMSTREIAEFIQAEGKLKFDEHLRQDLPWRKTIDEGRLRRYLEAAGIDHRHDAKALLANLGAGEVRSGTFHLNQAGVLFFGRQLDFPLFHARVFCALYKGLDKANILDRKELAGNLTENIEDAILFSKSTSTCARRSRG